MADPVFHKSRHNEFPMEHRSHICEKARPTTLNLLDSMQRVIICLLNDPILSVKLTFLAHICAVENLSFLY